MVYLYLEKCGLGNLKKNRLSYDHSNITPT